MIYNFKIFTDCQTRNSLLNDRVFFLVSSKKIITQNFLKKTVLLLNIKWRTYYTNKRMTLIRRYFELTLVHFSSTEVDGYVEKLWETISSLSA